MTTTIGWWDYDETDRPTLINRDSGERVRMGEEVSIAGKRPGQRWVRFDYLHDDLEFPVLVCWMPEEGHIVVDYLASVALWRRETNSDLPHPPYGTWVRVDDCIIDAIWCWPGVLGAIAGAQKVAQLPLNGWIGRAGGWSNAAWRADFNRADAFLPARIDEDYETSRQYPLEILAPLSQMPPSPWFFIDVAGSEDPRRSRWATWDNAPLHPDEGEDAQREYYGSSGLYENGGRRTVEIRGQVPQVRSTDGSRILYPLEATIRHGGGPDGPEDWIRFAYGKKTFGQVALSYDRVGPWESGKWTVWPSFRIISPDKTLGSPVRQLVFVENEAEVRRWSGDGVFQLLSLNARRQLARDITDAFLHWEGTREAPELWGPSKGIYLTYEKPDFIVAKNCAIGGRVSSVATFSAFSTPDEFENRGFAFRRFIGEI